MSNLENIINKAFDDKRWIGGDWKSKLSPFYDKAKHMLGATKAPYLGETDFILKFSFFSL